MLTFDYNNNFKYKLENYNKYKIYIRIQLVLVYYILSNIHKGTFCVFFFSFLILIIFDYTYPIVTTNCICLL